MEASGLWVFFYFFGDSASGFLDYFPLASIYPCLCFKVIFLGLMTIESLNEEDHLIFVSTVFLE